MDYSELLRVAQAEGINGYRSMTCLNHSPDQVSLKIGRLLLNKRFTSKGVILHSLQSITVFDFKSVNKNGLIWRIIQLVKVALGAILFSPTFLFTNRYKNWCSNRWQWVKTGIETHTFFAFGHPADRYFDWSEKYLTDKLKVAKQYSYRNIKNYNRTVARETQRYLEKRISDIGENKPIPLDFIKEKLA